MKRIIFGASRFYMTFMTCVYTLWFVLDGLDIDLYDFTNYENYEWTLALGLIGLLITNLIIVFSTAKREIMIEREESK